MSEEKTPTREMMEKIILTKLYRDGLIEVDAEIETAKIDARRAELVHRYGEESYDTIENILSRTAEGLKLAGYEVTVRRLE